MSPHDSCDWEQKREAINVKIEALQHGISENNADIKCIQKKLTDARVDLKVLTVALPDIQKDLDEIKKELKEQGTKNQSKLSRINLDIGKMQTRFATYAAIASFLVATGVSVLLKFVF